MRFEDERQESEEQRVGDEIIRKRYEEKYKHFDEKRATYDGWLDDFDREIEQCTTPIIDLGCGNGNNSRYLAQKGKTVIACDYIQEALNLIKENMPEVASTLCFDMRDGLPFDDNFTSIIIADLSLQYFTEGDTIRLLSEIRRVLKPNGILLFRVNSTNDIYNGSRDGNEISYHYRLTKEGNKRFFDKQDLQKFFSMFSSLHAKEETMTERYEKPKVLWRCVARK